MSALRVLSFLAAMAGVALAPAAAQTPADGLPPLIPVQHFFDNPEIAGAQISPDGNWLSYLKPYKGKLNIYIRRVGDTAERLMTTDTVRPVTAYFWAADASQLLYVQDKGGNENYHIYSVPVAGTDTPEARDLTPFEGARAVIFAVPDDLPERILVGLNRRDPSAFDPYWLELATGELTQVGENPGRHNAYLIDDQHRIRVALASNAAGGTEIQARDTEADPWRVVLSYPADESVAPLRIHPDGRRLYATSNHGDTNLSRLVFIDLQTGAETPIESDPENEVDFGGAVFSELTDEMLATFYSADTLRIYPRNDAFARDLARIRALHDGEPQFTSSTRDESKWIVSFDSPTDPGATYLYDRNTGEGTFLFRPRPWLVPEHLAEMTPVSYKAEDGLTIHGYLTTPRGVPARNLPLILLVHGGPWARDSWGYQPEAQLLANRGYAVLQINYRGSTGYGKAFYNAAVREWAGKMHTDLIDGVKWAVAEGIADPARVGIYGGSYGGYATLVALTTTPEVFACGVDYVGPSSLITLIESFPAYWRPFLEGSFYRHVGDPAKEEDRADMRARSPLFMVDRIVDPLLIVQGANDPRVTKLEADQLAIALRDRGVPVRYLLAENEGHGFANADNRMALYHAMQLFFADCLGGRAQTEVAPEIAKRIEELTVDVSRLSLSSGDSEPAVAVEFNGTDLAPATFEYKQTIEIRGQTIDGSSTRTIADGTEAGSPVWIVVDAAQTAMGAATDSVILDRATLLPVRRVARQGPAVIEMKFSGTGVTGSLQAGAQNMPINVTTDGHVLVEGAPLHFALGTLPLAEGWIGGFQTFDIMSARVSAQRAEVKGAESVTVAAGTFDAWRVELAGADGAPGTTLWIERAAPHRVVKSVTTLPAQMGAGTVTMELK